MESQHVRPASDWVVLDIETVAAPDCAELLDPVKPPSNYKDPLKIAAYCEEKRADQIARAALEPDLCEVVAYGIYSDAVLDTATRQDWDEAQMLVWLWRRIGACRIVGFSILNFDLLVLIRRSQLLGIPVPDISLDRYRTPHLDLLERLTFNGRLTMRSLAFYCRRFGIAVEDTVTGADIADLVIAGDWAAIEAHVRSDVAKTAALAQKLGWLC